MTIERFWSKLNKIILEVILVTKFHYVTIQLLKKNLQIAVFQVTVLINREHQLIWHH